MENTPNNLAVVPDQAIDYEVTAHVTFMVKATSRAAARKFVDNSIGWLEGHSVTEGLVQVEDDTNVIGKAGFVNVVDIEIEDDEA